MTWARVDENAPLHPKLVRAGFAAVGLWLAGLCHSNRLLSDGFIAKKDLFSLFPSAHKRALKNAVTRLVTVGLWHEIEAGYMIHDFLDYNPSRAEVLERRRIAKEAGKRGATLRWGVANPIGNPRPQSIATPITTPIHPCMPRPVPSPLTTKAFVVREPPNDESKELDPPFDGDASALIAAEARRLKEQFAVAACRARP